ncbi:MAG: ABC transporter ATP-binding protein, partial [Planctomycetota bacterium]
PLKRLYGLLKPEAQDVRTILIFSIVTGLLSLTTPLAVEAVVNTIAFGQYLQPLIVLSLIVLVFLGFRAGLNILMTVVTEVIQRKLFVRTVEDLAYRLTRVPLSKWKKKHGPELVNRFFDIVNIQKITSKLLLETLMLLLQTIIGLTVLAFYHPFLLGYDIGLLIMMSVVLWIMGRGAVKTAVDESELKYSTAAWLQEIVRHPSTFKFNGGLDFAISRADELTASYINQRQGHFKILIRQITFAMFMQVLAATVLLALGGYLVIQGEMTLGQLVAAELIVTVILGSFAKIGKDLESFYDLMASVDKLGKLFDLPVEPANKFQFPRREGAYDLTLVEARITSWHKKPASFGFERNGLYAIHGASELQRRELMEALTGQFKPEAGHVLVDEFRIDSITPESLQENVSLIREIELFAGSVDENIRMGRAGIGSREVNEIVNRLGLRETIAGSKDGYATRLCISGYPFSTGEAIRLVLARALISRPGILFIDGLLDRLSDEATEDVLNRLKTFREQTTIVISTGRGAIQKNADQAVDIGQASWRLEDCNG